MQLFIIFCRRVRSLSADDIQAALELQHNGSGEAKESQAGRFYLNCNDSCYMCALCLCIHWGAKPGICFLVVYGCSFCFIYHNPDSHLIGDHKFFCHINQSIKCSVLCSDYLLVIVAPHGMRGKLIGCYSSDLIQILHER